MLNLWKVVSSQFICGVGEDEGEGGSIPLFAFDEFGAEWDSRADDVFGVDEEFGDGSDGNSDDNEVWNMQ